MSAPPVAAVPAGQRLPTGRRPTASPVAVLGVALAVVAVGSSAASLGGLMVRQEATGSTGHAGVTTLDVDTAAGDVTVRADGGATTRVERSETWSLVRPVKREEVVDGTLHLRARCTSWFASCGVSYVVHVPKATVVRVRAGAGNVEVDRTEGDLDVHTGSGNALLYDVQARHITARTGSGNLSLYLQAAPDSMVLATGSGDLSAVLPDDGATAYDVSASTGSGSSYVDIRADRDSPRSLSARTGSGDLTLRYPGGR